MRRVYISQGEYLEESIRSEYIYVWRVSRGEYMRRVYIRPGEYREQNIYTSWRVS